MLEYQGDVTGEHFDGEVLGELNISSTSEVTMDIGLHTLKGRVVKLQQPFLILEQKATDGVIPCVGVVRKKILFDTRPNQRRVK